VPAPDPHPTSTIFISLWTSIGPLIGVIIGQLLSRSSQRDQWILDQRKQEARELLAALSKWLDDSDLLVQKHSADRSLRDYQSERSLPDREKVQLELLELKTRFEIEYREAYKRFNSALGERIFLAKELRVLIMSKVDWQPYNLEDLPKAGRSDDNSRADRLRADIISLALRTPPGWFTSLWQRIRYFRSNEYDHWRN